MARTGCVKPSPSVHCIWWIWFDQLPSEGDGGIEDSRSIRAELDPVVCEQEGGEEDQGEEEVDRGREGEGELGHPTPHNGEGRGITVGENLQEYLLIFLMKLAISVNSFFAVKQVPMGSRRL